MSYGRLRRRCRSMLWEARLVLVVDGFDDVDDGEHRKFLSLQLLSSCS